MSGSDDSMVTPPTVHTDRDWRGHQQAGTGIARKDLPSLSACHTFGASLQRRHPPVMVIVHRVRLFEPQLDRISTFLCFLGDDMRTAALRNEYQEGLELAC